MTNLEQLDIAIVEALWGMPYKEALELEMKSEDSRLMDEDRNLYKDLGYWGEKELVVSEYGYLSEKQDHESLLAVGIPNTIGRVMAALDKIEANLDLGPRADIVMTQSGQVFHCESGDWEELFHWKSLNEDRTECTTKDQSPETIEKLLELFKK